MRIVGGVARGRSIYIPKGCHIRVTTDRVKEALFSILGPLEECRFLDAFAGSGNVGIEALSRGARPVYFIENNRRHAAAIRKNLERCGFTAGFEIVPLDFEKGVARIEARGAACDVIYVDPPYEEGFATPVVDYIGTTGILAHEGIVVVEHSVRERCIGAGIMMLTEQRRYGDTVLSFLKACHQGDFNE